MYKVKYSKKFKKEFKRVKFNPSFDMDEFDKLIFLLHQGKELDEKYKDHSLQGDFKDYRECHLRPNILLIYEIDKINKTLYLDQIGSHSELFG